MVPQTGEPGGERGEARGGRDRQGGEAGRPREAVCFSHDPAEALGVSCQGSGCVTTTRCGLAAVENTVDARVTSRAWRECIS